MSLSKHAKIPSYDLPEELLSEIFKRLPVKYVLRCRAVQKSCTHLYTVRSDDSQSQEYCTFEYPHDLPPYAWIIPDSPLPRFSIKEFMWNALAFGFLPEVNDYVVVHVVKPRSTAQPYEIDLDDDPYESYLHSVKIGVYSLKTNSWKEISQDKVFVDYMHTNRPVFVNGTAFWVGYNSDAEYQLVMYFDTKTNILGQVAVPNWMMPHLRQSHTPNILLSGQSIAYSLRPIMYELV
ncbi:hypothetical protein POM88_037627 [Heracleum sosnowskyi]|uniref:F-box domain-containing protein n=1 Tax=Heracleum sosnowskyi TaxID=360622 RepID=A0AAD8MDG7_9APIA|nr:hypothetical protein POM88_037627 [Heracleum sosnowskyi]